MAIKDFERIEKEFEDTREKFGTRLRGLIDKRLEIIRRDVPNAAFTNAMGTSFLFDEMEFRKNSTHDPLYIAWNNIRDDTDPQTAESYGEDFPDYLERARVLTLKYWDLMKEIETIDEYMEDVVGVVYG